MTVAHALKHLAVTTIKPRVGERTWQQLRSAGRLLPERAGGASGRARARTAPKPAAKPAAKPARKTAPKTEAQLRREQLRQMSLTQLAQVFRTDKWGTHRYTPHYERHLQHLRRQKFTLLEIGVGGYARERKGGASLRMWKHFFPRAQIFGLDIEDKSFVDRKRIRTFQGSQTDEQLLRRIVAEAPDLRVVIDDGSHRPEHIRATFEVLFPLLPDGGVYAIEDTQTSYWPEWGGSEDRHDRTTTMALVKDLVDGLNFEEYVDEGYEPTYTDEHVVAVHCYHNLVIIEKGDNREGTNRRRALRARYAEPEDDS